MPDGTFKIVDTVGSIALKDSVVIHDVMFVNGFKHNLLSVGQLAKQSKIAVLFTEQGCYLQDHVNAKTIGIGKKEGGLYYFSASQAAGHDDAVVNQVVSIDILPNKSSTSLQNKCSKVVDINVLHQRMGHVSLSKMKHIKDCNCNGLNEYNCTVCLNSKFHKLPFPISKSIAKNCFDLLHIDLWGPYKVPALNGAKYFLTILDDCSRVTWTFLLNNKMQVYKTMVGFIAMIENQFGRSIKMFRSDNGSELIKEQCMSFFMAKGITHQKSVPGVPQQNGRVERKHKHLLEMSRALRFQAHLPKRFWGECILTATHLINKLPTKVLGWKSPYEIMIHKEPSYDNLRVFGSLCFAHNANKQKDKFDERARTCIFIGYPNGQKAYKLYDLNKKTCFVSRDVIFFETIFPYYDSVSFDKQSSVKLVSFGTEEISSASVNPASADINSTHTEHNNTHLMNDSESPVTSQPNVSSNIISNSNNKNVTDNDNQSIELSVQLPMQTQNIVQDQTLASRKSTRPVIMPNKYKDFIGSYIPHKKELTNSTSQSLSFAVNSHLVIEPKNYNRAKSHSGWVEAMNKEIKALEDNDTWIITKFPKGKKAIGSKWVYKTKLNPDGTIERLKARVVAIGYQQVEGKDFTQTFSPVAKLATVRVVIALAIVHNWPLCQLDVNNVFLHGYLDEEVYMIPPAGYEKVKPGDVCRLVKSIYGLKQASRQWNKELSKFLKSIGFV
ncbi:Retrovirus-related Pol polyprotein from transposon TNT 1-94 [Bienertia sinuspersici]